MKLIALLFLLGLCAPIHCLTDTTAPTHTDTTTLTAPDTDTPTTTDTTPPTTIQCTVQSQSQWFMAITGIISLILGAGGGTLVTHRVLNSVCIRGNITGDHATISIVSDDTATLPTDTVRTKTNSLTNLFNKITKSTNRSSIA